MTADLAPVPSGAPAPAATAARTDPRDRWGWSTVAAIAVVVAASWAPVLAAPFGDNHLGRVAARYALHASNLRDRGLLGSTFSAGWAPYSDGPYAHHPPLPNLLDALLVTLAGPGEFQIRIAEYLLALLAVPAGAALLRACGIRWVPTLLATALMVVTGFYWIYSPIMFDIGPILALSALVVHLRRHADPPGWLVALTALAAVVTTLSSWPGLAFAAALGLWLAAARRRDRVTLVVGAGMLAGAAVSVAFMFGVHGLGALADQTELRTAGGGFTAREFATRQWRYLTSLLPLWYLVLFPAALAAGLADRRTRVYTAVATVFAAGWVLVLNNGSFVHDYWAYLVLVPGLVGMGALLDRVVTWLAARSASLSPVTGAGAAGAALGLAAAFASMVAGQTGQDYVYRPIDAGRLVAQHPAAAGQEVAWHATRYGGFGAPRWIAYYWQLKPQVAEPRLLAERARPADLVIVDLGRPPQWLPDQTGPALPDPVARQGRYALYRAADLLAVAIPSEPAGQAR